jgi:pimeloyl-ACP methyl ester carboxylesterase
MSVLAPFFAAWEDSFTIAQWDQPLAGATYARHGEQVGDYSIDRLARDGIAVVEYLHSRFAALPSRPRVVPLAISGGTIVGLHMLKRRPDLLAAYVGTGQIVSWARQDALGYSLLLDWARANGNTQALTDLERIGPPPYSDTATDAVKSTYSGAYTPAEHAALQALDPAVLAALMTPPQGVNYLPPGVVLEKDVRSVAMAAYAKLRAEIVSFEADRLGHDFAVPMLFLQGEQDLLTVSSEVRSYADKVRAPHKAYVAIEGGGHSCWMMRDVFLNQLVAHLYPILKGP